MRKQTFLYIMFCVILLLYFLLPNTSCVFNDSIGNNKRYFFYAKTVNEQFNYNNCSIVKNGNAFIVSCDFKNRANTKKLCGEVLGESVNFFGNETDLFKILNYYSAEVVLNDCLENTQIYYCFSSKLGEGLYVYENLINMQIAVTQNNYTIGFPIILGSY